MLARSLVLVIAMAASTSATAQKKKFTIAEATNGLTTTLAPQSIKQASWQPGTHRFWQVVKVADGDAWLGTDFSTGKTDTVTLARLSRDFFGSPDSLKTMPALTWLPDGRFHFALGNRVFFSNDLRAPDATPVIRTLGEGAENTVVEGQRGAVAYTVGNNLWLNADGTNVAVTSDANAHIINGQSVHRNEFGIDGGIFFSPKASYLAYYRMDERAVKDYPVVRWNNLPATVDLIKYPMAGDSSHYVTVEVFDPAVRKTVTMQTGEPRDQYLTAVTWSPDEKFIFIALLNRGQDRLKLNQYDVRTGALVTTLFEEKDDKYVEPQHPLWFIPGKPTEFLWWSQRDGFMHLYHYNISGKLIRQLTKGAWLVNEIVGYSAKTGEVLITASKESPLEKHAYAVALKTGKMRRLDSEPGTHAPVATTDGAWLYDVWTSSTMQRQSAARSIDGNQVRVLAETKSALAAYDRAQVRSVTLKADDGTPLYAKLILPTDFDSTRKYPVIQYLYNGPHVQLVKNAFPESGNLWYEYLAQRGYVVFLMDGRGSSNRGIKFEQAPFRKLGTLEMNDQLQGVTYLKSLPYVDAQRIGVHGWSFGGFMTTSLLTRHPDVYACGVAGGPVMDWRMYEVMYTERYMDDSQTNPKGFEEANLLKRVKSLKAPLLLIHGTDDDVVVWQHSINFLKEAVSNGVQVDYFVYPGHQHNVRGKDRVHLMQKITDYFDAHLKPEAR